MDNVYAAAAWRADHLISSTGNNARLPDPMQTFASTPFSETVKTALTRAGFEKPTPTQAQSWPIVLAKHDLISIAKTGSGKTLAFLLPSFHRMAKAKVVAQTRTKQKYKYAYPVRSKQPQMLVVVPTRELAMQIEKECKMLIRAMPSLRAVAVYGGTAKQAQVDILEQGVDCLIGTPGRLLDLKDTLSFDKVDVLVLDEADKMLEMGFEPQLQAIRAVLPSSETRQTLLFSATWPMTVEALAAIFLRNPIHITIGAVQVNPDIEQRIEPCASDDDKASRLLQHCKTIVESAKKGIVFFKTKQSCDDMQAAAAAAGVTSIAVVHGDKSQEDRTMHLNRFKNGSALLLFATDVASRGLHVNDVACVINVDCPPNEETYIHRIGRTGRAGAKGQAITLVSPKDVGMVKTLLRVVREAGQSVPDDVLAWIQQQKQAKLPLENEEQQRKRGRDDAKTEPNRAKKSKKATPPPPPQKKKQKKKVGKRKQRLCQ